MSELTGLIYKWTNKHTNLSYIGQTTKEKQRYKQHLAMLGNSICKTKFQIALSEYDSEDDWIYNVLEDGLALEDMSEREKYWISFYDSVNNGYNMQPGGCPNAKVESRIKMSENHKGITSWLKSKHLSEETRNKIANTLTGYKHTEEAKLNMSKAGKGRIFSEEHRRNMSKAAKGRTLSEESRKKISKSLTGKKLSEEHKLKCNVCKGRHRQYNDPNDHSKGWKMVY